MMLARGTKLIVVGGFIFQIHAPTRKTASCHGVLPAIPRVVEDGVHEPVPLLREISSTARSRGL